ncbi:hypothetical protein D3C75_1079230 [compost metagenome]
MVGAGVDDHAGRMHITGLGPRGRVGYVQFGVDVEAIASAGRAPRLDHEPTVCPRLHGQGLAVFQHHADLLGVRRPEGEAGMFRIDHDCPVGPVFL